MPTIRRSRTSARPAPGATAATPPVDPTSGLVVPGADSTFDLDPVSDADPVLIADEIVAVEPNKHAFEANRLNAVQEAVLKDVQEKAEDRADAAMDGLIAQAQSSGFTQEDVEKALDFIEDVAPVTINFSPDKALALSTSSSLLDYAVSVDRASGRLIDAFLVDDHYKNQFETGITGGSSSAYPGGSRDNWEKTIFEGGYHQGDFLPAVRPKYGALNATLNAAGPAGQYGNCFFIVKPELRDRVTLTPFNSSGAQSTHVGTLEHFAHVLKDVSNFEQVMRVASGRDPFIDASSWNYIEAQIHGPVNFDLDLLQMVCAVQFRGTDYEAKLRQFAVKNGVQLIWMDEPHLWRPLRS